MKKNGFKLLSENELNQLREHSKISKEPVNLAGYDVRAINSDIKTTNLVGALVNQIVFWSDIFPLNATDKKLPMKIHGNFLQQKSMNEKIEKFYTNDLLIVLDSQISGQLYDYFAFSSESDSAIFEVTAYWGENDGKDRFVVQINPFFYKEMAPQIKSFKEHKNAPLETLDFKDNINTLNFFPSAGQSRTSIGKDFTDIGFKYS